MIKKENFKDVDERKPQKKELEIIVNGVKKQIEKKEISFEDAIRLAFGTFDSAATVAYTVTYSYKKGHHNDKGVLVKGDSVKLKEGMVFNVTRTTRS